MYMVDPISERPWVYHPDAGPGTHAILLAQPEPLEFGLWPLARMERLGVRADGKLVDLQDDEREVDDSKIRREYPGTSDQIRLDNGVSWSYDPVIVHTLVSWSSES